MSPKRVRFIHSFETACFTRPFPCEGRPALCPLREPELIQDVFSGIQALAESTPRISEHLKSLHPEVDWRAIAGFRNVLVHDYLGINLERVWEIVSVHLPVLALQMEAIWPEAIRLEGCFASHAGPPLLIGRVKRSSTWELADFARPPRGIRVPPWRTPRGLQFGECP
jgi:uncharacterized protein with HEPN domain